MNQAPNQSLGTTVACYAVDDAKFGGRLFEQEHQDRLGPFERDCHRIVRCSSFRRMLSKTQVLLSGEGDWYRTRLPHSLEVAQLARSMARQLHLNEDLAQAIALAHDMGHTPFGHSGQETLDHCMKSYGGFEHNFQSLRICDKLEVRYALFDGLNLSFATREGILKHCSRKNALYLEAKQPLGVAKRFVYGGQPSLEAQLCNLADEIAYNVHDIEDGLKAKILDLKQLSSVELFHRCSTQVLQKYPIVLSKGIVFVYETIDLMIDALLSDVIEHTQQNLTVVAPRDVEAVRNHATALLDFSPNMRSSLNDLKAFLHDNLYVHESVRAKMDHAQRVICTLFERYQEQNTLLPPDYVNRDHPERSIADYIAGMTDQYALEQYKSLTQRT